MHNDPLTRGFCVIICVAWKNAHIAINLSRLRASSRRAILASTIREVSIDTNAFDVGNVTLGFVRSIGLSIQFRKGKQVAELI